MPWSKICELIVHQTLKLLDTLVPFLKDNRWFELT